jgi:hypothetical protein
MGYIPCLQSIPIQAGINPEQRLSNQMYPLRLEHRMFPEALPVKPPELSTTVFIFDAQESCFKQEALKNPPFSGSQNCRRQSVPFPDQVFGIFFARMDLTKRLKYSYSMG